MKYFVTKRFLIFALIVAALILPVAIFAQSSSTVKTKVGNPVITASSCPIPGGRPTCGSQSTLASGCGHCTPEYIGTDPNLARMCSDPNYPGIHYAMDVGAGPLDPIFMPDVNGKRIKWTYVRQAVDGDGITAIIYYSGTDENTGEQYWIQFHHAKPDSSKPIAYSGEQGGQICQSGCKTGTGPHLHIEFASLDANGSRQWLDAPNYFCKN